MPPSNQQSSPVAPAIKPAFMRRYRLEVVFIIAAVALLCFLLWFRLGSLTGGLGSASELAARSAASSWQAILANPLNAPYTVVQRLVIGAGYDGITSMRLVSTAFAALAVSLFYMVARQWHSPRIAGLATFLFLTSAWFLHSARLATPEVLWLVAILALVMLFMPGRDNRYGRFALVGMLVVISLLLYVPALVWLVLLAVVLRRRSLGQAWQDSTGPLRAAAISIAIVLLVPLGRALYQTPALLRQWAGLMPQFEAPVLLAKQVLAIPKQLFIAGPIDPVQWLGRLPLLSVFELAMFTLGAYFYATHFKASRSRFIIVLSLLAWLVIGIGGVASLSLLVPVVYLVLTTGIAYMLHKWFKTFPRNPVARGLGIAVVAVAIGLTSFYQLSSYFVAWRYSPDTKQAFTRQL